MPNSVRQVWQWWRPLRRIVYRRLLPFGLALLTLVSVVGWALISRAASPAPDPAPPIEQTAPPPPESPRDGSGKPSGDTPQPSASPEIEVTTESAKSAESAAQAAENRQRQQQLIEADRLYLAGDHTAAKVIYRSVKPEFSTPTATIVPDPFTDPDLLSPGGRVYWRELQAGLESGLATKALVGGQLLVEKDPGFIPGYSRYADALQRYDTKEAALQVLERASALYPNQPDLIKAKVALFMEMEQWMEASISARQFAMLNPDLPEAAEFSKLADTNFDRFQGALREQITGNTIAGLLTGALSYALTGSIFGPLNAVQTAAFVLQGESSMGTSIADQLQQQLDMVDDLEVTTYLNDIGQRLADLSGRAGFDYQFYVINDPDLNAFALPGGKIFINSGAILKASSEAELAGLLGHEISHAVLSHSFQIITQATLLGNLAQLFPLGGTLANLVLLDYSRDMERQADILGTRVLVSGGYAADGLHNLMVTMAKDSPSTPFPWLSTHPVTTDRVAYLEALIQRNGYDRFAFEGVERHSQIQAKVTSLLPQDDKPSLDDNPSLQP